MPKRAPALATLAITLAPLAAHAEGLTVRTVEHGPWSEAVAVMERTPSSAGETLHVLVRDGERVVPCGEYALTLDAVGSQAFRIGACDATTRATEVQLVNRDALFAHDDIVPTPLAAGIDAVEVRRGGSAGVAEQTGGSDVECTASVRPYLEDLEHGTRVYLTPGRFSLRVLRTDVTVQSAPQGWQLQGHSRADVVVEYDVVDASTARAVLHERATLSCATESADAPPPPPVAAVAEIPAPAPAPAPSGHVAAEALRIDMGFALPTFSASEFAGSFTAVGATRPTTLSARGRDIGMAHPSEFTLDFEPLSFGIGSHFVVGALFGLGFGSTGIAPTTLEPSGVVVGTDLTTWRAALTLGTAWAIGPVSVRASVLAGGMGASVSLPEIWTTSEGSSTQVNGVLQTSGVFVEGRGELAFAVGRHATLGTYVGVGVLPESAVEGGVFLSAQSLAFRDAMAIHRHHRAAREARPRNA